MCAHFVCSRAIAAYDFCPIIRKSLTHCLLAVLYHMDVYVKRDHCTAPRAVQHPSMRSITIIRKLEVHEMGVKRHEVDAASI